MKLLNQLRLMFETACSDFADAVERFADDVTKGLKVLNQLYDLIVTPPVLIYGGLLIILYIVMVSQ